MKKVIFLIVFLIILGGVVFWGIWDKSHQEVGLFYSILSPLSSTCEQVIEVKVSADLNGNKYETILNKLFSGEGIESFDNPGLISSGFSSETGNILRQASLKDGILYIDLKDIRPDLSWVSSSCGSQAFMSQIEHTVKQFNEVDKIIYSINGDSEAFYEFIQIGCTEENNFCETIFNNED